MDEKTIDEALERFAKASAHPQASTCHKARFEFVAARAVLRTRLINAQEIAAELEAQYEAGAQPITDAAKAGA